MKIYAFELNYLCCKGLIFSVCLVEKLILSDLVT